MSWLSGACEPGGPGQPGDLGQGVGLLPWGDGGWALVVPPGSDPVSLSGTVARMPGGLRFAEAFGDVEVVLVYRPGEVETSRPGAVGAVLRAASGVGEAPADGRRWATEGERLAYLAGKADVADELRREVTGAVPREPTGGEGGAVRCELELPDARLLERVLARLRLSAGEESAVAGDVTSAPCSCR